MQFETTGSVSLTLGNTLVLFDGVPVPLTSVSSGQVTAIAPLGLKAAATKVQVQYGNQVSNGFSMPVAPATPGLFAVILNQDGTPNSASNPAAPGSVVSLFATGAGPVAPALQDGAIVTASNPQQLVLPVAVQIDGQQAAVVYAGGAPGIVQGISQINVRLPDGLSDGALAVLLQAGGQTSQGGVTLAVRSEPLLPLVRR